MQTCVGGGGTVNAWIELPGVEDPMSLYALRRNLDRVQVCVVDGNCDGLEVVLDDAPAGMSLLQRVALQLGLRISVRRLIQGESGPV
jgi:hypothetical protein